MPIDRNPLTFDHFLLRLIFKQDALLDHGFSSERSSRESERQRERERERKKTGRRKVERARKPCLFVDNFAQIVSRKRRTAGCYFTDCTEKSIVAFAEQRIIEAI